MKSTGNPISQPQTFTQINLNVLGMTKAECMVIIYCLYLNL